MPKVELSLGRMVNPEDLEEGDDIYFSCSIEANPPAYKITWWHNVREIRSRSCHLGRCTNDTCTRSGGEGQGKFPKLTIGREVAWI